MSDLLRSTRPFAKFRSALAQSGCGVVLVETSPRMRSLQATQLLGGSAAAVDAAAAAAAADSLHAPVTVPVVGREGVQLTWHDSVETVTSSLASSSAASSSSSPSDSIAASSSPPPPTLFIANEFFDALPVHQLVYNGKGAAAAAVAAAAAAAATVTGQHLEPSDLFFITLSLAWHEHMVVRGSVICTFETDSLC
jgi:SAM-dependent MidA family methyltransferase